MADRYDKALIAQRLKLGEIGVAIIGVLGFATHSVFVMFIALFLFGVIGSLFGPIKYGILPDHLQRSELPAANALVEGATFIAILLGLIVGGLAAKDGGDPTVVRVLLIAVLGDVLEREPVHPADRRGGARSGHPVATSSPPPASLISHLRDDRRIWWGAMVTSWFWLVGSVSLSLLPPMVKNILGGTEEVVTVCLAIFSISIAVGSGLAAWLAAGRIILLPTLIGAVLLGLFSIDLGWSLWGVVPPATPQGIGDIFSSGRGIHMAIDLAGPRDRRRSVHRADVLGGAGLGRHRPARARGGRRERAQRRLHDVQRAGSSRCCRNSA